jgi:hypothetical protein
LFPRGFSHLVILGKMIVDISEVDQSFLGNERAVSTDEFIHHFAFMKERAADDLQSPAGLHE